MPIIVRAIKASFMADPSKNDIDGCNLTTMQFKSLS